MKQFDILKKIGVIIKELDEQYQFIEETKHDINDLELELFVANTQFLIEHIEILRKLNYQHHVNQRPEQRLISGEKYFEPLVQQNQANEEHEPFTEPEIYLLEPDDGLHNNREVEEPVAEPELTDKTPPVIDLFTQPEFEPANEPNPTLDFVANVDAEVEHNEDVIKKEDVMPHTAVWEFDVQAERQHDHEAETDTALELEMVNEPVDSTTEDDVEDDIVSVTQEEAINPVDAKAEVFPKVETEPIVDAPEKQTVNQALSSQPLQAAHMANHLEVQPIKDLKAAINLNDKMLFVRDLFNGYSLSYSEAIEILNRFAKFDEADAFLKQNYIVKNNWEGKQSTYDKFYAVIKRRFPQ